MCWVVWFSYEPIFISENDLVPQWVLIGELSYRADHPGFWGLWGEGKKPLGWSLGGLLTPLDIPSYFSYYPAKMNNRWLNIFGLCCGMVGVVVLFLWGPPQPTLETGVSIAIEDRTVIDQKTGKTVADHNREIEKKRVRYKLMSQIGLGLVGVGFLFQLVAECRTE